MKVIGKTIEDGQIDEGAISAGWSTTRIDQINVESIVNYYALLGNSGNTRVTDGNESSFHNSQSAFCRAGGAMSGIRRLACCYISAQQEIALDARNCNQQAGEDSEYERIKPNGVSRNPKRLGLVPSLPISMAALELVALCSCCGGCRDDSNVIPIANTATVNSASKRISGIRNLINIR
jgi:hypothetical protein